MTSILEESKKSRTNGVFGFWRNKKFIFALVIIVICTAVYFFWPKHKEESGEVMSQKEWTVKKGDIVVSVESDGSVVAEDGVELSFGINDDNLEVKEIFVKEGDVLKQGDKIASVETKSLELSLQSAWSSYQSALADYNETIDGASEEDKQSAKDKITSAELSLEQSEISLANTRQLVEDSLYNSEKALADAKEGKEKNKDINSSETVEDAYEDLLDTIKPISITLEKLLPDSDEIVGVDDEFINDDYESNLGVKNLGSLSQARGSYAQAKELKEDLDEFVLTLSRGSEYTEILEAANKAETTLDKFEDHLYDMQLLLNASVASGNLTQTQLDSFKNTVNTNRSSVNTKITSLDTKVDAIEDAIEAIDDYVEDYEDAVRDFENAKADAERDIANAEASVESKKLSLEQARRDYEELLAPLSASELASAKSKLTNSSVSLQKAQNELEEATITSPIDGQVVELNYKTGDIIVDNDDPVAVILNPETLFVEVAAEEADVSKLVVGQKAVATFDALDGVELEGEISFISLTSNTSNNGIVTYEVRVLINNPNSASSEQASGQQIREGMTASIEFVAQEVKDVLTVPVASVRNVQGSPSVQLQSGEWRTVTTAFTDGKYVEVISGLAAGDLIVY